MKIIFLLSFFLSSLLVASAGQVVASGGSPVPTAFDPADAQSVVLTCNHSKQVAFHNETASRIAWGLGTASAAPASDAGYVVANSSNWRDGYTVSRDDVIYIRSDSGSTITSGTISVECW